MRSDTVAPLGRDLGWMLRVLGGLILISVVVPLVWGEYYAVPGLVISGLVPVAIGWGLSTAFADADSPDKLHGMMIAATGWFAIAVFGSLPFLTVAWIATLTPGGLGLATPPLTESLTVFTNPLNAIFESMSGFTGTGLTMAEDESTLPRTLQWWRSLIQWVGGVGVIVLTTAILARPGSGSLTLYKSEARSQKIHPSIVSTVQTIWWIFLLFTSLSILLLWLAGLPPWQAINHGMTAISTGGFSVIDGSIGAYDSVVIEAVLLPIMIAGGIAFPVHYLVLQGDLRGLYTDLQTRWLAAVLVVGSVFLWLLVSPAYDSVMEAFRYGVFQFVSALTATGFQTATEPAPLSLAVWPTSALLTLVFAMVVGAAAGSTAGGIKLIRLIMLVKGIRFRVSYVFYPDSTVHRLWIDDRVLDEEEGPREFGEAAIIALLWFVFLATSLFILLMTLPSETYPLEMILFEIASAQGNIGLSAGITGPESLPTAGKLAFILNMWIGRLEIIPILVTLRALFWRGGIYE
ncbi:trk system potassium uptake protein TrkH [Natrinema hispanicum]|uniref:Trk system potassium uptake protein TrkH n=1 Tax=Natrinema hispanicum TaxID=392421 RepID=A0A482Y5F2_9EURY|nr:TrkH family potassium uptake protein [Natrinema hispanicum]RZV06201.1 trk system potassium uptake protein TrkH [Natrinema hispanicum]